MRRVSKARAKTFGQFAPRRRKDTLNIILIILVILLLGSGGYGLLGGNEAFGPAFGYGSGGIGLLLLIVLIVVLARGT